MDEYTCKHCNGTGKEFPDCSECEGRGWVEDPDDGGTMVCPECDDEPCSECDGTGEDAKEGGDKVNIENDKRIVIELAAGERTWALCGTFHDFQGFTLFPLKNDELVFLRSDTISRVVTLAEVQELKDSPHCQNKEAVEWLLKAAEAAASDG